MNGHVGRIFNAAVVVVLLAGSFWLGQRLVHGRASHRTTAPGAPVNIPETVTATDLEGHAAPVHTGTLERPTLLLVFSTDCPYCERNMAGWRDLIASVRGLTDSGPDIVGLSLSEAAATEQFLAAHEVDLPVRLIDDAALGKLGVLGTPATVGVRPGAETLRTWFGVLDAERSAEILQWAGEAGPIAEVLEKP